MSSCPRPCKIQTGRDRTINRCLSLLQITYVKDSTYVPSVLNNHTNSQMLSNCNTAATQILNISHSKRKKKKYTTNQKTSTVMDIEEFIFTGQNSELRSQKGRLDVAEWLGNHKSNWDQCRCWHRDDKHQLGPVPEWIVMAGDPVAEQSDIHEEQGSVTPLPRSSSH